MATKREKEKLLTLYTEAANMNAKQKYADINPHSERFCDGFAHGLSRAMDAVGMDSQERYTVWLEALAAAEKWWLDLDKQVSSQAITLAALDIA